MSQVFLQFMRGLTNSAKTEVSLHSKLVEFRIFADNILAEMGLINKEIFTIISAKS